MNYNVLTIPPFDRQLKRLVKKYPSIENDLRELGKQLSKNPVMGKPIGRNCYKIRLAITSKNKGKSGGARVITNVYLSETTVYLLAIYNKSEREDISDKELAELLGSI